MILSETLSAAEQKKSGILKRLGFEQAGLAPGLKEVSYGLTPNLVSSSFSDVDPDCDEPDLVAGQDAGSDLESGFWSNDLGYPNDVQGYAFSTARSLDQRVYAIPRAASQLIAQLEFAYPEATYALLGRDSSFLADILEGYYLGIGQQHRVVRLDASGPTLKDQTDNVLLKFMTQNGLQLDAEGKPLHPYIVIDATRWQKESQSRRLVGAVYRNYRGSQLSDLAPLINAVGQGTAQSARTAHDGTDIKLAVFFLRSAMTAQAQSAAYLELLKSPTRPTIASVEKLLDGDPDLQVTFSDELEKYFSYLHSTYAARLRPCLVSQGIQSFDRRAAQMR